MIKTRRGEGPVYLSEIKGQREHHSTSVHWPINGYLILTPSELLEDGVDVLSFGDRSLRRNGVRRSTLRVPVSWDLRLTTTVSETVGPEVTDYPRLDGWCDSVNGPNNGPCGYLNRQETRWLKTSKRKYVVESNEILWYCFLSNVQQDNLC